MACRACFKDGRQDDDDGTWFLLNNPGYWGSSTPKTLVLGFSKGAKQIRAATGKDFDAVAFAGWRDRLAESLAGVGVDLEGQTIDEVLSASSKNIGSASLVRCGLSLKKPNGNMVSSGSIMPDAVKAELPLSAMRKCIATHLDPLPDSVESVILLGTTDGYMIGVKSLMKERFSDYKEINSVAFIAQGRTWVFASHPSRLNGHHDNWVKGEQSNTSGRKKLLALATRKAALNS